MAGAHLRLEPGEGRALHGARGCLDCLQTGYSGRTGVFEVLRITRELRPFIAELMSVVEQEDAKPILLNLRRTIYFSSMGYSALFKLVKFAKERQRPVRFCNMHPDVRVGGDIVGLPLVVEIHDTEESALRAFSPA